MAPSPGQEREEEQDGDVALPQGSVRARQGRAVRLGSWARPEQRFWADTCCPSPCPQPKRLAHRWVFQLMSLR